MTRRLLIACLAALAFVVGAAPPPVLGHQGMVATDHRLASEAGAEVLRRGGNAVDAAVAAALAAGVVQPAGSGLGGGGFAVVVTSDGTPHALDFREVAPVAATADMFLKAPKGASITGGLAVAVPGEPTGLAELQSRWGRLSLTEVARPAIQLARKGFRVGAHLAEGLAHVEPDLAQALFGGVGIPTRGQWVRRLKLARTISTWARSGGTALSRGPLADDIVQAVRAAGGMLTAADLARYRPRDRQPMVGKYRGWTVITMPPPSSGGIVLLQALRVLEGYDLASLGLNSSELIHLYAETFQHAYADRAHFMGDPDRVQVPVDRLLSDRRIEEIRRKIWPERTFDRDWYGAPVDIGHDSGTEHISVIDGDGLSVALTTTINTSFGSKVVAPKSGIVLNNEMDDFVTRPGEPNIYGLVGSPANAVAPGARPLSSMTPTVLVSPDGKRRIAIGGSGGPYIISSTLQVIVDIIDFGLDPSTAVATPRIHHQWVPRVLFVDAGIPLDVIRNVRGHGYEVKQMPFFSAVQVVEDLGDGTFLGASDPRKGGWPAAG